ncbi:MAG: FtsX-like permease family protein [Desulfobacteraceae bacterium]|nr:MAG: FtsX-like permease family protein [Desulfobacteraceae bacterium]
MAGIRLLRPIHIWAMRDILRRPGEALMLGAVLCLLIAFSGAALLLTQSLSYTARKIIALAPSLVVRKTGPAGWEPIPEKAALECALSVPGITAATARIWGLAAGPLGSVTVVGAGVRTEVPVPGSGLGQLPKEGEAAIGEGVGPLKEWDTLKLAGARSSAFKIVSRFPADASIAVHDVVLLHKKDAMRILGLPEGFASDIAVDVFNEQEQSAILPDLSRAFPWPVSITTRRETAGYYAASFSKRGGIVSMVLIPSMTALCLLMIYLVRERTGRRHEVGLLKSMGWTTVDVVKLQLFRTLFVALPSSALGCLAAYLLVLWPGVRWPSELFLGWKGILPGLYLDTTGAALVLLEVGSLALVPFLAAALWPALGSAAADPQDMIEEER